MWFEVLTGFSEESPQQVRENIRVDGTVLQSKVNGKSWVCGQLETPTLSQLRERVESSKQRGGKISVREIVANVQHLHASPSNAGSLFQVASQFNLLEMVSPNVTPDQGVGIYEHDRTQGPACAMSAGAGTIYRNYFAIVNGQMGQSAQNQIDCLADIGSALGNQDNRLWQMQNGYVLASHDGLVEIAHRLESSSEDELDKLRQLLRIGIQWNTQVTIQGVHHSVSQAYCSALPVAYSPHSSHLWGLFARLVLDAAYEATICTAILNRINTGNNRVFLTLLGGGSFGNKIDWIIGAIKRSLDLYNQSDLDLVIVSHGSANPQVKNIVTTDK
jgi:hypothetical protein